MASAPGGRQEVSGDELRFLADKAAQASMDVARLRDRVQDIVNSVDRRGWNAGVFDDQWARARFDLTGLSERFASRRAELLTRSAEADVLNSRSSATLGAYGEPLVSDVSSGGLPFVQVAGTAVDGWPILAPDLSAGSVSVSAAVPLEGAPGQPQLSGQAGLDVAPVTVDGIVAQGVPLGPAAGPDQVQAGDRWYADNQTPTGLTGGAGITLDAGQWGLAGQAPDGTGGSLDGGPQAWPPLTPGDSFGPPIDGQLPGGGFGPPTDGQLPGGGQMPPIDGQLPGGGFGPPVVMPLPGGGTMPIPGLPTGIGGGIATGTFGIGGWTLSNTTDPVSSQPGEPGTGGDASPPVEGQPGVPTDTPPPPTPPTQPTPGPEPVPAPPDPTPAPAPPAPVPVDVTIDGTKSPEAVQHIKDAQDAGHPDVLLIDRPGSTARRQASLRGIDTSPGNDRDEYPPAVTQQGGAGASVRPIPRGDNRSAGGQLGGQIRQLPDGTWIRVRVIPADPTPIPADPSSPSLVP